MFYRPYDVVLLAVERWEESEPRETSPRGGNSHSPHGRGQRSEVTGWLLIWTSFDYMNILVSFIRKEIVFCQINIFEIFHRSIDTKGGDNILTIDYQLTRLPSLTLIMTLRRERREVCRSPGDRTPASLPQSGVGLSLGRRYPQQSRGSLLIRGRMDLSVHLLCIDILNQSGISI